MGEGEEKIYLLVFVQVRWLQMLSQHRDIEEVPSFSEDAMSILEDTISNFGVPDALAVKKVERTTNHDVKAIEYVLKDRFRFNAELSKVCICAYQLQQFLMSLHFFDRLYEIGLQCICTSHIVLRYSFFCSCFLLSQNLFVLLLCSPGHANL